MNEDEILGAMVKVDGLEWPMCPFIVKEHMMEDQILGATAVFDGF